MSAARGSTEAGAEWGQGYSVAWVSLPRPRPRNRSRCEALSSRKAQTARNCRAISDGRRAGRRRARGCQNLPKPRAHVRFMPGASKNCLQNKYFPVRAKRSPQACLRLARDDFEAELSMEFDGAKRLAGCVEAVFRTACVRAPEVGISSRGLALPKYSGTARSRGTTWPRDEPVGRAARLSSRRDSLHPLPAFGGRLPALGPSRRVQIVPDLIWYDPTRNVELRRNLVVKDEEVVRLQRFVYKGKQRQGSLASSASLLGLSARASIWLDVYL